MKSEYSRTGARRAGDDYQDLMALEVFVDFLEHPKMYQWIRVEADDAGFLDDVVALRTDGSFEVKQVKFTTHPELDTNVLTWSYLLEKRKGKTEKLPSLLEKWASSINILQKQGSIYKASLESNRRPANEIQVTLSLDGLVNIDNINDTHIRKTIIKQLGDEATTRSFFSKFHFILNRPSIEVLEESIKKRFYKLGGEVHGWLNLKDELRFWIRNRNQPPPNGTITLGVVRSAGGWYQFQSLPQQFEIPKDYVLPPQNFHKEFVQHLLSLKKGCLVLTASPGVGKSTYLSYLYEQLVKNNVPVIRNHYFLSLSDKTVRRLDSHRVSESLMSDIENNFPEALGESSVRNPTPALLATWIDCCGQYFTQQKKALIIIIDGL
jgi:hypothetical protein